MGKELGRLRMLLHREPHVRGLGYGQYAAASDDGAADPDTGEGEGEDSDT